MKKKIFAILMTLILIVSLFASVPVIADEADSGEVGGLDFYSITLHYESPVLVSYYKTKIDVVNEKGKTQKVDVEYFYNTNAESDEGKYIDDKYLTVDLALSYQATDDLSIYAKGYNIFNEVYAEFAGTTNGSYDYPAQSRRFIVGAEYKF